MPLMRLWKKVQRRTSISQPERVLFVFFVVLQALHQRRISKKSTATCANARTPWSKLASSA